VRARGDGTISVHTAKLRLGVNGKTLMRAADAGYVHGLTRTERGGYYATLEAWRQGYEAYMQAKGRGNPADVPQGWISSAEAARRLKVSHETMLAIARARLAPVYSRRTRTSERYYAHPQAWERALRWWRQRHGAEERRKMVPAPSVDPETARRRLESLTPYQRIALRVYIRAVMLGLPMGQHWGRRLRDEYETVAAMYGWQESA